MADQDPAAQFFPDQEEPDLYGALGLEEGATADEIKKAYRRSALLHHPDKAGTSEASVQKFQQIGFAYAVLSDEKRRKRFDETGRTDESFFDGEADWNAYFKELWKGEVNQKTLDDFVETYKGSDEERADILAAYTSSSGSLDALFENVMVSNVLDDEDRFISIIEAAIKSKEVEAFPQWKKDVKDTKARNKRKEHAKGEAKEAEELAKELGVHDKLFGKKDEKATSNAKGKRKAKVSDDAGDEDALRALIQAKNAKQNRMGSLIEKLEAQYGGEAEGGKKGKGAGSRKGKKWGQEAEPPEPTDEEFEALQKKMFGDKASKESKGKDSGPSKRSKRG